MKKTPKSLKIWFIIHFIVDMIFAIPLLFFPDFFLEWFGLIMFETATARLTGAALVGIGGTSFVIRNASVDAYRALLKLKLLWSGSAILALTLALWSGEVSQLWIILIIFAGFFALWSYYLGRLES